MSEENEKPSNFLVLGGVEARVEAEQMQEDEHDISYFKSPDQGNILKIGGSIFFLRYWKTSQIEKAYDQIQRALLQEILDRGGKVIDPKGEQNESS